MFFSKNVSINHRTQLSDEMGMQWTNDHGKYLGVLNFYPRVSRGTFQFIVHNFHLRLSAWKAKTLSFAGKVILAKSVLQSLPSNVMQTTLILRLVCDVLTRSVVVSFGETHEMVQRFILFLGTTFVLLNLREVWD